MYVDEAQIIQQHSTLDLNARCISTINMLPIPSRIHPLPNKSSSSATYEPEDPIDIFSLALSSGTLFPDHPITSHGDPGGRIGYTSPKFGEIVLDIPKHPDEETGRGLFAHYLWSAAAVAAAAIEQGSSDSKSAVWDFRNCRVLEVGAGKLHGPLFISSMSQTFRSDVVHRFLCGL